MLLFCPPRLPPCAEVGQAFEAASNSNAITKQAHALLRKAIIAECTYMKQQHVVLAKTSFLSMLPHLEVPSAHSDEFRAVNVALLADSLVGAHEEYLKQYLHCRDKLKRLAETDSENEGVKAWMRYFRIQDRDLLIFVDGFRATVGALDRALSVDVYKTVIGDVGAMMDAINSRDAELMTLLREWTLRSAMAPVRKSLDAALEGASAGAISQLAARVQAMSAGTLSATGDGGAVDANPGPGGTGGGGQGSDANVDDGEHAGTDADSNIEERILQARKLVRAAERERLDGILGTAPVVRKEICDGCPKALQNARNGGSAPPF